MRGGTHSWGQQFRAWDEISFPDNRVGDWAISNPSAPLDGQQFSSQRSVDFLTDQVNILHETHPQNVDDARW